MPFKVVHYSDVQADPVPDLEGVTIRWVIAKDDAAPNFAMRHFTISPGGHTPHHTHAWEHEVYILSGSGKAIGPDGEVALQPGTVIFVAPNDEHHFENDTDKPLSFLCLVPLPE